MIEYESRTARLATPSEKSKYESVGECFMIQPINLIDAAILRLTLSLSIILLVMPDSVHAKSQHAAWTKQETAVRHQIRRLASLRAVARRRTTEQLAIDIRRLPAKP